MLGLCTGTAGPHSVVIDQADMGQYWRIYAAVAAAAAEVQDNTVVAVVGQVSGNESFDCVLMLGGGALDTVKLAVVVGSEAKLSQPVAK